MSIYNELGPSKIRQRREGTRLIMEKRMELCFFPTRVGIPVLVFVICLSTFFVSSHGVQTIMFPAKEKAELEKRKLPRPKCYWYC